MFKYRFNMTIDDTVHAENEYEAWAQFRNRVIDRFYGPINEQIELLEEVPPPEETPGEE